MNSPKADTEFAGYATRKAETKAGNAPACSRRGRRRPRDMVRMRPIRWGAAATAVGFLATLVGCNPADQYPRRVPPPVDAQHPFQFGSVTNLQATGNGSAPKPIALTFDDGPSAYSEQIVAILREQHVPATFFVVGKEVEGRSSVVKDELDWGNRVGSHTWSHLDLTKLTPAEITSQVDQTQAVLRPLLGDDPTRCLRPPYDATNATVVATLARSGLASTLYDIDPLDWKRPGVATIVAQVLNAAHPGAVVDLHDGGGDRSQTVAALPGIITGLRQRGYTFVSIC